MIGAGASDSGDEGRGWADLMAEGRAPMAGLLLLGIWLNAADALVTVTLMPSVARNLGGYAYFAWASAGFLLGGIVASASAGWLSTRIGLKRALTVGGLAYLAGCVMSAAAPGILAFLVGRLVQGVGAGWIVGLCFVVIGVVFPERVAAKMFAALSGVWGGATLLGPLVGGVFATFGLWRWAFWAFALQSVIFVWGVRALLPSDRPDPSAPTEGAPWTQLALVTAGVMAIALADVKPAWGLGLILTGVAVLAVVPAVDRRSRTRLLPDVALDPTSRSAAGYAAVFLLSAGSIVHSVYSPVLLQTLHGVSPLVAGYAVTAEAMGWSFVAVAVGSAAPGRQRLFIRIGAPAVAAGQALLAVLVGGAPLLAVALAAALMGAGFGLSFAFMNARIIEGLDGTERALASSAVPTVQTIGNAVGAALSGVAAAALGLGKPFDAQTAAHAALPLFGVMTPLTALGVLAAWRLAGRAAPQ